MATYQELNAMEPEIFLNPDNFKTSMDHLPPTGYAEEQFQKGLKVSNESIAVGISINGTWWAEYKDGSYLSSYEGIGYHSCTCELLRGLLAGTAKFIVMRFNDKGLTETCIKE